MKYIISLLLCITVVAAAFYHFSSDDNSKKEVVKKDYFSKKGVPSENFFMQRVWPDTVFALAAYEQAMQLARQSFNSSSTAGSRTALWTLEGPGNISGRINTIAVHPLNQDIIYIGTASGGVFKTTNGGQTWLPVFDDQPYLSIGHIAIDPNNPNTIYVGTGDVNISGYPFIGDGIYKSTDAGQTWTLLGLTETRVISKIIVHPSNSNIVYAAAMGLPMERNNHRGLYKSTDGGVSWNQILFLSNETGVIDILSDPANPNIIYAAGWDRIRTNKESLTFGAGARIHKSIDGGNNWMILGGGLPVTHASRIGLAITPGNPNEIYAQYIDTTFETMGIYKTSNGGANWTSIAISDISAALGGFGWYFGKIRINPYNTSEIFVLGVDLWRSSNGGSSWQMATPDWWQYVVHSDKHDLFFLNSTSMLLATDGGIYKTSDSGISWTKLGSIPNTQFYRVQVNPHIPGDYWGGAQDNGTLRSNASGINQWERMFGGDGFQVRFHPTNSDIIYTEWQYGNIVVSLDGGWSFIDATDGLAFGDRRHWDMPYIISPHNSNVLYCGTQRVYKSQAGAVPYWNPVSQDITDGNIFGEKFHTISTLCESPLQQGYLFAGTTDGNVWRSLNDGASWDSIHTGLPVRYVTDIKASTVNKNVVFVSNSGYKENDYIPHIHMSDNLGSSWIDISGNLPPLAVNNIELMPGRDSTIFVATDGGVYYTIDIGYNWQRLGDNMPFVTIYDIDIDFYNKRLVAATFARSIMSIDIDFLFAPPPPIVAYAGPNDTICYGQTTNLTASGGQFYQWFPSAGLSCTNCPNPIATPAVTTTYMVQVSSNAGASDTAHVTITVHPAPAVPQIVRNTDTLLVLQTAQSYQWYYNGNIISSATGPFHIPLSTGTYMVQTTNSFGCSSVSSHFSYIMPGISAHDANITISVYPNPASKEMHVEVGDLINLPLTLLLLDIRGTVVLERPFNSSKIIPVDHLSKGIYFLMLNDSENRWIKKVMVE